MQYKNCPICQKCYDECPGDWCGQGIMIEVCPECKALLKEAIDKWVDKLIVDTKGLSGLRAIYNWMVYHPTDTHKMYNVKTEERK